MTASFDAVVAALKRRPSLTYQEAKKLKGCRKLAPVSYGRAKLLLGLSKKKAKEPTLNTKRVFKAKNRMPPNLVPGIVKFVDESRDWDMDHIPYVNGEPAGDPTVEAVMHALRLRRSYLELLKTLQQRLEEQLLLIKETLSQS